MASSAGTKVTKDPEAINHPKNENPGVVTSDSLAGESIRSGGSFGANADARGAMGQPSSSTTTNTTDTSSATRLDPARDARDRLGPDDGSGVAELQQGAGVGPTYNTSSSSDGGGGSSKSENQQADGSRNAGEAPGYASHSAPGVGDTFKPKGARLQEGGFDSDAANASFTTDIGGKDDPGRVALAGLQQNNVPVAGGAGPRQGEVTGDGQYDALKDASA